MAHLSPDMSDINMVRLAHQVMLADRDKKIAERDARIAELEAALKPFAELTILKTPYYIDLKWMDYKILATDIRAARKALGDNKDYIFTEGEI